MKARSPLHRRLNRYLRRSRRSCCNLIVHKSAKEISGEGCNGEEKVFHTLRLKSPGKYSDVNFANRAGQTVRKRKGSSCAHQERCFLNSNANYNGGQRSAGQFTKWPPWPVFPPLQLSFPVCSVLQNNGFPKLLLWEVLPDCVIRHHDIEARLWQ